jgi:hypothetical protein
MRLADHARKLGGRKLLETATLVTSDTILRWCRKLVAQMYDGSKKRRLGWPRRPADIEQLILVVCQNKVERIREQIQVVEPFGERPIGAGFQEFEHVIFSL